MDLCTLVKNEVSMKFWILQLVTVDPSKLCKASFWVPFLLFYMFLNNVARCGFSPVALQTFIWLGLHSFVEIPDSILWLFPAAIRLSERIHLRINSLQNISPRKMWKRFCILNFHDFRKCANVEFRKWHRFHAFSGRFAAMKKFSNVWRKAISFFFEATDRRSRAAVPNLLKRPPLLPSPSPHFRLHNFDFGWNTSSPNLLCGVNKQSNLRAHYTYCKLENAYRNTCKLFLL